VAAGSGSLTAGGSSLLPVSPSSKLDGLKGERARGKDVIVQAIVPGRGFWVGTSKTDRFCVEYGTGGFGSEAGSAFKGEVGDHVKLTGVLQKAPADPVGFLKCLPGGRCADHSAGLVHQRQPPERRQGRLTVAGEFAASRVSCPSASPPWTGDSGTSWPR